VAVYGEERYCADCVDCDTHLGVCEYEGGGGYVGSEGKVEGECVLLGVSLITYLCYWKLRNIIREPGKLASQLPAYASSFERSNEC
jgi:hypothetical protein